MGGFSRKARTDDEGGPRWVFIKKRTEGFEQKREVLLIRFPAADGDNLILFLDGGGEFKDIGLNGVRNKVDFFWIGTKATSEGFPECRGLRSFDKNRGKKPKSFSQAILDPRGGEDGSEGVEN